VTFPAFKAGVSALRGSNGGFDSHTLPPYLIGMKVVAKKNETAKSGINGKGTGFVVLI